MYRGGSWRRRPERRSGADRPDDGRISGTPPHGNARRGLMSSGTGPSTSVSRACLLSRSVRRADGRRDGRGPSTCCAGSARPTRSWSPSARSLRRSSSGAVDPLHQPPVLQAWGTSGATRDMLLARVGRPSPPPTRRWSRARSSIPRAGSHASLQPDLGDARGRHPLMLAGLGVGLGSPPGCSTSVARGS